MSGHSLSVARLRRLLRCLGDRVASRAHSASDLPNQVEDQRPPIETDRTRSGGSTEIFDQPEAVEINRARVSHLASLGLPIDGERVLDVGCGVGHLAQFFVSRGCRVVCVDGREQNIASLRMRYPGLVAHVANVEAESLARFGTFDIVFCYGLLYHLENPLLALRNMASVCEGLLLLETMVCDHPLPVLRLDEEAAAFNQALFGLGCRPSPSYLSLALNRVGFQFVYTPTVPPEHQDFRFEWKRNLDWWRDGHPLRATFVASRTALQNAQLMVLPRQPG